MNAMVTGNMDYCNSLLHGTTAGQLEILHKIQNTAARLILRRNRRSSATVMLHGLDWLPIKKRVMHKLLLMVYKSQHDMVPDYIQLIFLTIRHPVFYDLVKIDNWLL